MKYRHAIQHIFRPEFLVWTGVLFAAFRVSVAFAITQSFLHMLDRMYALQHAAQVSQAPFLDVLAVVLRAGVWGPVLVLCGVLFAFGCCARITLSVLSVWFLGMCVVYMHLVVFPELGVWFWPLSVFLLAGFGVRWGHVWGIDDIVFRIWTGVRGKKVRDILFG